MTSDDAPAMAYLKASPNSNLTFVRMKGIVKSGCLVLNIKSMLFHQISMWVMCLSLVHVLPSLLASGI